MSTRRSLTILGVLAVLVGFLSIGAAEAEAQGTLVYDYDDYRAWWDSFDCDARKVLLPIIAGGARADDDEDAHEARVCVMSAGLEPEDLITVRSFIESAAVMKGPYEDNEAWWGANGGDTGTDRSVRQALTGRIAIAKPEGTFGLAAADDDENDYSDDYDRLRATPMDRVMMSGNALSGRMMDDMEDDEDPMETPALPLVGLLLLGAGLVAAGRRRLRQ